MATLDVAVCVAKFKPNIRELTMSKLEELLARQEALAVEIEAAKKQQKVDDLKTVRQLCKAHGFTANMLKGYLGTGRIRKAKGEKAAS
jgi:hypothetical protein